MMLSVKLDYLRRDILRNYMRYVITKVYKVIFIY